jgi:hypothetical protein
MNEGLERLKSIGAQKIYEETHIPINYVQAIIYESFDGFSRVQFIGFISILEREYGEDLSALKAHGLEYFDEYHSNDSNKSVFVEKTKRKKINLFYILVAVIIFLSTAYYTINSYGKNINTEIKVIESNTTDSVEKNTETFDSNESVNDTNSTINNQNNVKEKTVSESEELEKKNIDLSKSTLKIVAKTKVWLGYIDINTNKKYQKTFSGEFELDPSKEWLLYFGHGYIDIVLNGKVQKFSSRNSVRFLYKNGEIKEISVDEFKKLNRGFKW